MRTYTNFLKCLPFSRAEFYSSFFKGTQIIGCTVSCMAKLLFIKIGKKVAEFSWTLKCSVNKDYYIFLVGTPTEGCWVSYHYIIIRTQ